MESSKYIEQEFLNESELVERAIKTRALNGISSIIKDLKSRTINKEILSYLASLESLTEDAYKIDMYKFQFKLFCLAINKELQNAKLNIDNE